MTNKIKIALLGATALFASTAAHAQIADTWTIGGGAGDATITANNQADVTLNAPSGDAAAIGTAGATVDGTKNSVSASALGASASAGYNVTAGAESGTSLTANVANATLAVTATNGGNVSNIGQIGISGDTAVAVTGQLNSVSRVALGASAGVNASTTVLAGDEGTNVLAYTAPVTSVSAFNNLNADDESNTVFLGTAINATIDPNGTTALGNGNSVSAAAIGSSASVGFSSTVLAGGETGTFNLTQNGDGDPTALNVTSVNTANVAIGGIDTTDVAAPTATLLTAAINGADSTAAANGNSVSSTALGASAGVSYSLTNYGSTAPIANSAGFGAAVVDGEGSFLDDGGVNIAAVNGATYEDNGDGTFTITPLETQTTVTNMTSMDTVSIGGAPDSNLASNNSISVAGIGASASYSFSVNEYAGAANTVSSNLVGGTATLLATNYSAVNVESGITSAAISGGLNNSISVAALGASASQSFSMFTK